MSAPDYRRLAQIIREQNPAPKGSDDFYDGVRAACMQIVADAYDTLADEQDAQPQLVEVTTYGSKEREYADEHGNIVHTAPYDQEQSEA